MTTIFSNLNISIATIADVVAIKDLLNNAYRGESSKQGWTTEAHLIGGTVRTNEATVIQVMQEANSIFLKYTNTENAVIGCVNLQQHGRKIYLGMFSVSPLLQGEGIGKQLLFAAEAYAKSLHCLSIYMRVISVRTELISWYQRYGYKDTGERKQFIEDNLTGNHLQKLEFMVLQKDL
jgi:ribosomal protein S18 acetylase RimI-like enzyme